MLASSTETCTRTLGREQCVNVERFLDGNQERFLSVVLEM